MQQDHRANIILCKQVTDKLVQEIGKSCPNLRWFEAPHDDYLSDHGLVQLANCPHLTSIILSGRDRGYLSGKSVAVLLVKLASLELLVCGPRMKSEATDLLVCGCQSGLRDSGYQCPCNSELANEIIFYLNLETLSLTTRDMRSYR